MPNLMVFTGEVLGAYGFGEDHPFGPDRYTAFDQRYRELGLDKQVQESAPRIATQNIIERFHTHDYVELVKARSLSGDGYLDAGDTPAFKGIYEAAATVVGTAVEAVDAIMQGRCQRAFIPIAGLHHARRDQAAGFCVFNDCGVVIETLLEEYALERIAYVDIDAHHGDGVFYGFEDNPGVLFADIHEDGNFLYPGTGFIDETGKGVAQGTKLNLPAPPGSRDDVFDVYWDKIEDYLVKHRPQFIILQAGADSIEGDPITHMQFTAQAHAKAAKRLCKIADQFADGRLLVMGGGGYNRENLATAWTAVIQAVIDAG
jgi:acetoin utilization protein AcuC